MYSEEEHVEGNRARQSSSLSTGTYQLAATKRSMWHSCWCRAAFGQPEQGAPRQGTGCHCGPRVHNNYCQVGWCKHGVYCVTAVEELLLTQEEADTRLLLHARHAAVSGYETVLIRTRDTDVAIIACSVSHVMPCTLPVEVGAGNNQRTVNMTAIAEKLSADVCNALPGLHAFTGSDSTSAFAFRGKSAAFNIVRGDGPASESARIAMCELGRAFTPLTPATLDAIERFTCQIYKASKCQHVNEARYELFCLKNQQSDQLPPCKDALLHHSARANHQAAIWRLCLVAKPEIPQPHQQGQGKIPHSHNYIEFSHNYNYIFNLQSLWLLTLVS
eukprot:scpid94076/ scgid10417/ 